jgi:Tfp pilus assembly protein PilN
LPLIIAVTLGLITVSAVKQKMSYKKLLAQKEEVAAKQKELNEKIDLLTLEKNSVEVRQKQVSTIQQIQARKVTWSDVFKELSLLIARDIWLSSLQADAKNGKRAVVIEGSGESPAAVSLFFQSLELSYFFKRVMLVSSTLDEKTYPSLYRYRFSVPIDEGRDTVSMSAAAPANPAKPAKAAPAASPSPSASPNEAAKPNLKEITKEAP